MTTTAVNPWAVLDDTVLAVFRSSDPLSTGDVLRRLPDLTHREVRTALTLLVERGHLTAVRGAVHTTYTLTEQGRRHLAAAKVA